MKHQLLMLAVIVSLFFSVGAYTVFAHSSGPPYVKINDIYAQSNPILTYTSPMAMTLGSDIASASAYIVNRPVSFEVDEQFFPNPYVFGTEKVITKYRWNFGDETQKSEGRVVSHTYAKSGTFLVDLEVLYVGKTTEFAKVNQIQINILPKDGYVLPSAKISVNGHLVLDPTKDIREIRGNRSIVFDASKSSGDIVSYTWDFSDEQKGSGKTLKHAYKHSDYFPMFPVLRVTDKNNISSDTFVFLDAPQSNNVFMNVVGWFQDMFVTVKNVFTKQ